MPPVMASPLDPRDFSLFNSGNPQWPVLVTVPHAGRDYPPEMRDQVRVGIPDLLALEDRHADLLADGCIGRGFQVIVARRPRAWIDLNRAEDEIDADMVDGIGWSQLPAASRKVRGGLGLVPRRIGEMENFWLDTLAADELARRIRNLHRPFHDLVAATLRDIVVVHGVAVLLDLHSMPSLSELRGGAAIQVVAGDLNGRSADDRFSHGIVAMAIEHGWMASLNHPYPGGHCLRRHHDRAANIHAVQLEVDRALYLDSGQREPGPGLAVATRFVTETATRLAADAARLTWPAAAE